ncbi:class I SAM-dependent RNA methyltransferase [Ornithobacterium rhinotracheale]|uniref:THUMP domain-containing class I SAM-dependent RNA methyltransferase n=1 Tax=Ornithobacterium rhinotracheale TaxID=28251 RepID=UPI00129CBFF5|nr:THUMP domain-containing protein [Ornithobacterium rhinotracheale]MRJ10109.1 class I SAM-dependent RNA methyltransferase [Ornithobacterium rhinotracheale]
MENFKMQAKTFYGFEKILAKEIRELGGANVKIKNRLVEFEGDNGFMYKVNYSLRTAVRILKPIERFKAKNENELYRAVKNFAWEKIFHENQTFRIDFTVNSPNFKHSQFAALKVKDAIVDRFRDLTGKRPSVEKNTPDIVINLHISHTTVTLSLDSSGEALFKRGYRQETGAAPMNEVMAAGLLKMAGWDGKGNFLDPMCGSGTLLIEAAMIAMNIPPQLHRPHFSFENWQDFDADLFQKIKQTRIDRIQEFHGEIIGYDINMLMIKVAEKNIQAADLQDFITVKQVNFFQTKKEHFPLLIVFNPPYGERLEVKTEDFYRKIGDTLKNNYPNTFAWFITSDVESAKDTGLWYTEKIKLYNGKIETEFVKYEIYDKAKDDEGN